MSNQPKHPVFALWEENYVNLLWPGFEPATDRVLSGQFTLGDIGAFGSDGR